MLLLKNVVFNTIYYIYKTGSAKLTLLEIIFLIISYSSLLSKTGIYFNLMTLSLLARAFYLFFLFFFFLTFRLILFLRFILYVRLILFLRFILYFRLKPNEYLSKNGKLRSSSSGVFLFIIVCPPSTNAQGKTKGTKHRADF